MLNAAVAEHLVLLATRAPSLHNSQPWSLVVTENGIDVRADRTRQLVVIDPVGRQLLASCGALVHHLCIAARALGFEAEPSILPEPDNPDLVARVGLAPRAELPTPEDVSRAEAILHRATNRRRFSSSPVATAVIESLRSAVEDQGVLLAEVHDEDRVAVDVLVEHAEHELLADDGYRVELKAWVFDPARDGERADGMPVAAVDGGPDRAEEVPGRRFVPADTEPYAPHEAERPTLLVLTTPADQPLDWVRSGMGLSALLLGAAREGLVAQPIGQVTDVAQERARLRHELGLVGVPQLLLRLGRATKDLGLQTPRRTVDEVLTWSRAAALVSPGARPA